MGDLEEDFVGDTEEFLVEGCDGGLLLALESGSDRFFEEDLEKMPGRTISEDDAGVG